MNSPLALSRTLCTIAFAGLTVLAGCEIGVEETAAVDGVTQPPPADGAWRPGSPKSPPSHNPRVERGHLKFVEGFRAGREQAAAQSKPMLLFFTAEWCTYCHQMAQEAFTHPRVVALSERFVCILIDADHEPEVCQQFGVTGYPTIQFLSVRGVPLDRVVGKQPGHQLMMAMQAALQSVARRDHHAKPRLAR